MNRCDQHDIDILLYVNDQLTGPELEAFLAHTEECGDCRQQIREERMLSDLFRRSRPLYTASDGLRASVADVVAGGASTASSPLPVPTGWNWYLRAGAIAAVLFVIVMGLVLAPAVVRRADAAAFVDTAVSAHRSYSRNQLPLEIVSNSPEEIAAWFDGKVPFPFRLPVGQNSPDWRPAYRLAGARVVRFQRDNAALVSYQANDETITLLVTSEKSAKALGGDEVRSGSLIFHYIPRPALSVITWNTHGLTYALVSSIRGSAKHSCLVCHQSMADKSNFQ